MRRRQDGTAAAPAGPGVGAECTEAERTDGVPDRGSAAVIMVVFGFVFVALAAFVVDGGLAISTQQRAEDIAEQAARYAAQDVDEDTLRESGSTEINKEACEGRVASFAGEFELTRGHIGTSRCLRNADPPHAITVEVDVVYTPIFTAFLTEERTTVGRSTAHAEAG